MCIIEYCSWFARWELNIPIMLCTIMEKSSAPFSLGGENLKRYFDQR